MKVLNKDTSGEFSKLIKRELGEEKMKGDSLIQVLGEFMSHSHGGCRASRAIFSVFKSKFYVSIIQVKTCYTYFWQMGEFLSLFCEGKWPAK